MSRDQRQAFGGVVALVLGLAVLLASSDGSARRVEMDAETILVVLP